MRRYFGRETCWLSESDMILVRIALSVTFLICVGAFAADGNSSDGDFVYAELASGSLDERIGVNSNVTTLKIGGQNLLRDHFYVAVDYSARFIHPQNTTTELYSLLPGIKFRYQIIDELELGAGVKLGYLWAKQTQDIDGVNLYSENSVQWGGMTELRYRVSNDWELSVAGELKNSDTVDEHIFYLFSEYYVSPDVKLGIFYSHTNGDYNTAKIKGESTSNDGGLVVTYFF